MTKPNIWKPLVDLYRLGALPIGYSGGAFVIWCPKSGAGKRRAKKVTAS